MGTASLGKAPYATFAWQTYLKQTSFSCGGQNEKRKKKIHSLQISVNFEIIQFGQFSVHKKIPYPPPPSYVPKYVQIGQRTDHSVFRHLKGRS